MSEPIEWMPDGTPYSPRFGDRYHSEQGGITQARDTFLRGCGLPAAWKGQPQWRILETGFGFGLNFLVTWAAWAADPERPRLLHFVSCEAWPVSAADLLRAAGAHPDLLPLAQQLHDQFWGLLPGVHRLSFEGGAVLLTLYVGDAQAMLRQQAPQADSVYLDGFSPQRNPGMWDAHTLKAVARCCRRGTRLATWTISRPVRDALAQCGFIVQKVPGTPPKRDNLQATYDPAWTPRVSQQAEGIDPPVTQAGRCVVIGGGMSGAATARSLARRGWRVQVLDQAATPAAGASGLPAGLFAPHVSRDDAVLSRLTRSGVRTTLNALAALPGLKPGQDWAACGVLEHRVDRDAGVPADWKDGAGDAWSGPASHDQLEQAGLPADTVACWHARGGWVKPARLVAELLAHDAITWRGKLQVATLRRDESSALWQCFDAEGVLLAEADCVVVAAAGGSGPLLQHRWRLQSLRGQISSGTVPAGAQAAWPPFPVNGNGNLLPCVPGVPGDSEESSSQWHLGSTFERGESRLPLTAEEEAAAHAANHAKLRVLLPAAAEQLAEHPPSSAWAGVRCASTDRLPLAGPADALAWPALWVCTAMGARGLTLSLLCAELIAARLHGEPLPLDARLARALAPERLAPAEAAPRAAS